MQGDIFMNVIEVSKITKDYGGRRGVFDLSFDIPKGEVFGFLGPNGAGKTTTIRQLLGFIKPDKGSVRIEGKEVWQNYYFTNSRIGYLPGEINFPKSIKGEELIRWLAKFRNLNDLS